MGKKLNFVAGALILIIFTMFFQSSSLLSLPYTLTVFMLGAITSPATPDEGAPWLVDMQTYNVTRREPCLTEAQRETLRAYLREQETFLLERGLIEPPLATHVLFAWPLRQSSDLKDPNYWLTGTYLDEDRDTGEQIDYMGGNRTYDNHSGTDTGSACFQWARQSMNATQVIAAAPGVILAKLDDAYDRSCGPQQDYNGIFIRHDDGSQAWYIHTKRKSLTTKGVGERIAQGEYLGQMGSAGNSSGPHLHFEVYDSTGKLIDPYYGPYNQLNTDSWWIKQKPYRDSAITLLLLSNANVVYNPCPIVETTYASDSFLPGQLVYFNVYYRDTNGPQKADFWLFRPDGTVLYQWNSTIDVKWDVLIQCWGWYIPTDGPVGAWKFQAKYCGKTSVRRFTVTQKSIPMKITSLNPSTIKAGTTTDIQIRGVAFEKGSGVAIHKSLKADDVGIYVNSVEFKSSTLLVATVEAQSRAKTGDHVVVVTRPDFVQAIKKNALNVIR
jgi:murein DD-endopeptidase MepM/ murein hydrolase activator NlpD